MNLFNFLPWILCPSRVKPGFHRSEKSQTIGDFIVSRLSQTNEYRRYPRSSGMDGDKSGESGAFLFSRRVPDFWDGRRSFATNGNTNMYRSGTSAMDFAHYQSPKLLGSSSPITNKHGAVTVIWASPVGDAQNADRIDFA